MSGYNSRDELLFYAIYVQDQSLFEDTEKRWDEVGPLMMFQR